MQIAKRIQVKEKEKLKALQKQAAETNKQKIIMAAVCLLLNKLVKPMLLKIKNIIVLKK